MSPRMNGFSSSQLAPPPASAAGRLIALFARDGYVRAQPEILQPIAPFLNLSGEDIRRRMFTTQDGEGREMCLRPEFTIPVALDYLTDSAWVPGAEQPSPAAFSYAGPVFRLRTGESGEFLQAGLESFGRSDTEAADAEIVALTLGGLAALDVHDPIIRMGDIGLLNAALGGLDVPAAARRRFLRAMANGTDPVAALDAPASLAASATDHAGLLSALEGQDPAAAKAFVEDVLSIAGLSAVGGRSARDIAERFLSRARERDNPVGEPARSALQGLLAISGDPDHALAELRDLAAHTPLDIAAELDMLEARIGFMAARGVDLGQVVFAPAIARNLDYYTGMIFEIVVPGQLPGKPLAGGGRYDRLLRQLGAPADMAAVGASIWLDRVAAGAA
jgi:ATP phosphoribosyltransferase regulatory subunit